MTPAERERLRWVARNILRLARTKDFDHEAELTVYHDELEKLYTAPPTEVFVGVGDRPGATDEQKLNEAIHGRTIVADVPGGQYELAVSVIGDNFIHMTHKRTFPIGD